MFVSQSCICICDVLYPMICVYDLHRNLEPFLPQKESKGFSLLKIKTILSVLLDSMGTLKFAIWLEFSSLLRPLIYTLYPMKNVRKPVTEGETARPVHGGVGGGRYSFPQANRGSRQLLFARSFFRNLQHPCEQYQNFRTSEVDVKD